MPRLRAETLEGVRERIEGAALECFVRCGYSATTTREIAAAAGTTAGALYNHYPGKEALFAAVVARYRHKLATSDNPVLEVLGRSRFPYDIPELAGAIQALIERDRSYWLLWYIDVLEFDGAHFQSALAPDAILKHEGLDARLAELGREGTLRVAPELAFVMVYMHLFNYFLIEVVFRGDHHYGAPHEQAVGAIADVFLHGMLSPDARADGPGPAAQATTQRSAAT